MAGPLGFGKARLRENLPGIQKALEETIKGFLV
jgi:hypothetical protein